MNTSTPECEAFLQRDVRFISEEVRICLNPPDSNQESFVFYQWYSKQAEQSMKEAQRGVEVEAETLLYLHLQSDW